MNDKRLELEWRRGFYCAVSTLVRAHGCAVEAQDVLRACGKVNFEGIDDYDVQALMPIAAEIKRRKAIA